MSSRDKSGEGRPYDIAASLTIVVVAIAALVGSMFMPWWVMEARAPQYGQRVLILEVSPQGVTGDTAEMNGLNHYVGIRPLEELAPLERAVAPAGVVVAALGLGAAMFFRRRWLRALAVLPAIAMPIVFLADLNYWMQKSTRERDPDAALNLTVTTIETKLFGKYELAQFKINAKVTGGLFLASTAGLLGAGLILAGPIPLRLRRRKGSEGAGAGSAAGAAAAAGAALLLSSGDAFSAEKTVAPGQSVQSVIAAAAEGDIVRVPAGLYKERIVINKRIRLTGEPGAVIDGGGEGTLVDIRANGTELRGLTFRNGGSTYSREDAGIRIEKANDVTIADCRIEDTLFGIFAVEANRCLIEGTTVIGKDLPHVRRGDGVRLWYSNGCVLRKNTVERSRDVIIWYSADTVVEENLVRTSRYGLHYMYSDKNVFHRNRFEDNQVGATIMYSHGVELTENAFSFSNGIAAYGLLVKDADDIFIERNRFVGNATALFFDNAPQSKGARVTVHQNLIARNDVGLALQPLSRRIEIWENSFIGNGTQVQIAGTGTAEANVWAVGGRGNYWSDAFTYDRDGDGVSEIPYRLESTYESLADRYPALTFFQGSPGADAIDSAARLFPIFAPRPKMTDPAPLRRPVLNTWTERGEDSAGSGMLALGGFMIAASAGVVALGRRALA